MFWPFLSNNPQGCSQPLTTPVPANLVFKGSCKQYGAHKLMQVNTSNIDNKYIFKKRKEQC